MTYPSKILWKSFIIGSSLPVFLVPLLGYLVFAKITNPETSYNLIMIPLSYPILMGILNVLYVSLRESLPIKNEGHRYLIIGFLFGFILSLIGKYLFDFPTAHLETPVHLQFLVHIIAPITYALVFRYIIKPLNENLSIR